eukprot:3940593-Pyramimonas_sp.AAC.1
MGVDRQGRRSRGGGRKQEAANFYGRRHVEDSKGEMDGTRSDPDLLDLENLSPVFAKSSVFLILQ